MDWKPKAPVLANSAWSEPTKPSKHGSAGFDGATSAESCEAAPDPGPAELARASAVLRRSGIRLLQLEGITTVGIWSDLDGPSVRAALRIFGSAWLPIRYLDGAGVPMRFKLRLVEGEPVPLNVLSEMERQSAAPWSVRDRMLQGMGWRAKGTRQPRPTGAATT
jgi:hypothetical protein